MIDPFKRFLKSFIFTDCVCPSILLYNTVCLCSEQFLPGNRHCRYTVVLINQSEHFFSCSLNSENFRVYVCSGFNTDNFCWDKHPGKPSSLDRSSSWHISSPILMVARYPFPQYAYPWLLHKVALRTAFNSATDNIQSGQIAADSNLNVSRYSHSPKVNRTVCFAMLRTTSDSGHSSLFSVEYSGCHLIFH